MRPKLYKNPPIREALVEFRFASNQDWNITVHGQFHALIKEKYPDVKHHIRREFQVDEKGVKFSQGLGKTNFLNNDQNRIIGLEKDLLSVHMIRPYQKDDSASSGWSEFKIRIKEALDAYYEVNEPQGVTRIGLRYINEISGSDKSKASDYLKCAPNSIENFPEMTGFMARVERKYDESTKLFVTRVSNDENGNEPVFILDIELVWEGEALDREKTILQTATLRERERDVFEELITEKARDLFDVK